MKKNYFLALLFGMIMLMFAGNAFAVSVSSGGVNSTGTLTDLGYFTAGTYTITGSGVVGLTGDDRFLMNPDGTPNSSVTYPGYSYFNPSGSTSADGSYGAAGSSVLIGALIGTLSSTPTTGDWFVIGYSTTITLTTDGHIWASVNDTYHNNNKGSFEAVVTATATPVPAAVWLFGSGLIGLAGLRRRARK